MGKWIQNRDANWRVTYTGGWCLAYVEDAFGTAHLYPNATNSWENAKGKHYDLPPAGITVPVYFSLGNVPEGHIAISLDDLMVASSTQSGTHPQGYIHKNIQDMINLYGKYNGGCTYLGWSEELAGTTIVSYEPEVSYEDETKTELFDFETNKIPDPNKYIGDDIVVQDGVVGSRTIIYRVKYSDGIEISREVISDITTKPKTKVLYYGTKENTTTVEPETPIIPDLKPISETKPEEPTNTQVHSLSQFLVSLGNWIMSKKDEINELIKSILAKLKK